MIKPHKTSRPHLILSASAVLTAAALACNIFGVEDQIDPQISGTDPGESALEPTPLEPTAEPTRAPDVDYQGIQFSYEDGIGGYVNMEIVPAIGPGETAEWAYMPDYVQFTFGDYMLPDTFHEARLMVIPVEAYKAANPMVTNVIDALSALLASRPAAPGKSLPFLPLWNAGALIQSNAAFLDFQNGSGVRYLTQHGQSYWPVNNHDLFYTFQGLTADGRFYVSAILPVSHPQLPATGDDIPGGDYTAFGDNFTNYVAEMEIVLAGYTDDSFVPSLQWLDAMISSIRTE